MHASFIRILALSFILLGALACARFEHLRPVGVKKERPHLVPSWIESLDPNYESGNLPIALQIPVIHDQILYVFSNRNQVRAYDLATKRVLWQVNNQGPFHAGGIVVEDILYYGNAQGRLFARKIASGELVFEIDLGASVETTPVFSRGRLFVQLRNHSIISMDAVTGKILWAYKRSVPFVTTLQRASRPLVHLNKVFVGFADGQVVALGMEDGLLLWEQVISNGTKFIDVDSSPILVNDKLMIGASTGPLLVINPENGSIIQRLDYASTRHPFHSGRAYYVGSTDGQLIQLDEYLKETKTLKLSQSAISSIVKWKDKLVVATVGEDIFVVSPLAFEVVQQFRLGHHHSGIFGGLTTSDEFLVAISSRNRLYIFQ